MHKFLVIYKDNKCRRFYCNLSHIEDLQSSSSVRRRLLQSYSLGKDLVENTCLNTKCLILNDHINIFKKFRKSLACFCRDKNNLGIWHKGKDLTDLLCMLVDSLVVLLNGIPFIYRYNDTLTSVMCDTCNLGILLCNSLRSIDHNNYHICTLHCSYCTDNAVTLDLFFYFAFTAKSCCIDKYIILMIPCNLGINGITCGSCDIGYDHSLLTKKFINEGGFTHIRLTYNGDLRNIILIFFLTLIREFSDHFIQHISKSLSVSC